MRSTHQQREEFSSNTKAADLGRRFLKGSHLSFGGRQGPKRCHLCSGWKQLWRPKPSQVLKSSPNRSCGSASGRRRRSMVSLPAGRIGGGAHPSIARVRLPRTGMLSFPGTLKVFVALEACDLIEFIAAKIELSLFAQRTYHEFVAQRALGDSFSTVTRCTGDGSGTSRSVCGGSGTSPTGGGREFWSGRIPDTA